jgi:hypothetical protein
VTFRASVKTGTDIRNVTSNILVKIFFIYLLLN